MQPVANVLSVGLSDLVSTRNASLRRAGFEVVAVTSLEEAREACESWLFDVIVVGHTLSAREKALLIRLSVDELAGQGLGGQQITRKRSA